MNDVDKRDSFEWETEPWTVGQLRAALAGVPDELPIAVHAAQEAGGLYVTSQVVTSAHPSAEEPGIADGDRFTIACDFPSGYYVEPRYPRPGVMDMPQPGSNR